MSDPENPPVPGPSSVDAPVSATPETGSGRQTGAAPQAQESALQKGSIRLFRVAGIDVLLHWSWFFFALLRLQSPGTDGTFAFVHYDAQVWYFFEYLALFALVLLHEFGHVLACRSVGGIANCIVLWPLGGIALVDPPARPGPLLWCIAAGPFVNLLLLAPTIGFWFVCRVAGYEDTAPDLYRFAVALAYINGYLLLFNVLPVFPLDGGRVLQALLWFVMGRARSLQVATVVGLLTTLGLLVVTIVERSLVWGIMAGCGVLFSLAGLQGARHVIRMLGAPRREGAACPGCGAAPPIGNFWACQRCWLLCDAFATSGICPNCSTPLATVLCAECGLTRPYLAWHAGVIPSKVVDAPLQPTSTVRPATVKQRVVWGLIFALFALALCGLPNVDEQPLGLIVWTVGGAILGAVSAGTMTRTFRTSQARRKLRDIWRLIEVDGQKVPDGAAETRWLNLNYAFYDERVGEHRDVKGTCWTDPLAEPAAISFTPKMGTDAGKPRQGIYLLDGTTLTICLANPGQPRPTSFVAQPDIQQVRKYRRRKARD
jgi:uncharacterized protein (TIGR03067 family)